MINLRVSAETLERAIEAAMNVRTNAYAPYSKFHVGAALVDADGGIHVGCNVENASYGLTNCAERAAVAAATAAGRRDIVLCAQRPPAQMRGTAWMIFCRMPSDQTLSNTLQT